MKKRDSLHELSIADNNDLKPKEEISPVTDSILKPIAKLDHNIVLNCGLEKQACTTTSSPIYKENTCTTKIRRKTSNPEALKATALLNHKKHVMKFQKQIELDNEIKKKRRKKQVCSNINIKSECKNEDSDFSDNAKVDKCCGKKWTEKRSLEYYLKNHTDAEFLCTLCGNVYLTKSDYIEHIKNGNNVEFECSLCDRKFARRQQYDQHMVGHRKYSCSSCNVTFSTNRLLSKHNKSVHGVVPPKNHVCSICKKRFIRPILLRTHVRTHTGEKPVSCSICGINFSNEKSLSNHLKSKRHLLRENNGEDVHVEKPFLCATCGTKFIRRHSLKRHVKLVHQTSGELLKCSQCEYSTNFRPNLRRHEEVHNATKRFVCEMCGARFRAFTSLREHHAYVHSEHRGFTCSKCDRAFKNKTNLIRHLRIHSKVRPYKCHCGRDYKRLSHLKRHTASAHNAPNLEQKVELTTVNENGQTDQLIGEKDRTKLQCLDDQTFVPVYNLPEYTDDDGAKSSLLNQVSLDRTALKDSIATESSITFNPLTSLREHHTYVHSEHRGFTCSKCDCAFKNKTNLIRHLRIHSEVRPYKCHCGRDYKRLSHLKRHTASAHNAPNLEQNVKLTTINENGQTDQLIGEKDRTKLQCLDDQTFVPVYNRPENTVDDGAKSSLLKQVSCDKTALKDSIGTESLITFNQPPSNTYFSFITQASPVNSDNSASEFLNNSKSDEFEDASQRSQSAPTFSTLPTSLRTSDLSSVLLNNNPSLHFEPGVSALGKRLPEESFDILSFVCSELFELKDRENLVDCSSGEFILDEDSSFRNSNILLDSKNNEIGNGKEVVKFPELSSNILSGSKELLACNLVFPNDPFMDCSIDVESFASEDFMLSHT